MGDVLLARVRRALPKHMRSLRKTPGSFRTVRCVESGIFTEIECESHGASMNPSRLLLGLLAQISRQANQTLQ